MRPSLRMRSSRELNPPMEKKNKSRQTKTNLWKAYDFLVRKKREPAKENGPSFMARPIPRASIPSSGNLSGIFLLISKWWQLMPHGGACLHVQIPHGGASERVQMTNLWNKKTIIAHKLMYFYRICNSSNRFLTAKTAPFSRTVHVLSVISRSQVETITC